MKTISTKLALMLIASFFMNTLHAQSLVAYYPFSGNANDVSGNGYNATNSNAVLTVDRFGAPDKAYSFGGLATISFSATPLQFNNYTYSVWAKVDVIPNNKTAYALLSIGNGTALGDQHLLLGNQYSTPVTHGFGAGSYTNPSRYPLPPSSAITGVLPSVSQWYHIVMVRDTIRNKLILFVDGVKKREDSLGILKAGYATPVIASIGARTPGNSQYFKGSLDDIRIYDYALTDADVVALYNTEKLATGISEYTFVNHSLSVYPNPSTGVINITANNLPGKLTIYNAQGLAVYIKSEFSGIAEVADLKAGIYFCSVEDMNGNYAVKKFVITQ